MTAPATSRMLSRIAIDLEIRLPPEGRICHWVAQRDLRVGASWGVDDTVCFDRDRDASRCGARRHLDARQSGAGGRAFFGGADIDERVGLETAASCDLRIATDRSAFGMPSVVEAGVRTFGKACATGEPREYMKCFLSWKR